MGSSSTGEKRTFAWRLLAFFVVGFLLAVSKYDMRHVERIPKGAFVFAPNHYSNIDPLISAYVLWKNRRIPRFLVKASLFKVPVFGRDPARDRADPGAAHRRRSWLARGGRQARG